MIKQLLLLTILNSNIVYAEDKNIVMTPLDHAYVEATKNSKEAIFYNAFLTATIFIPTLDSPDEEKQTRAGDNDTISPIIIESDGDQYIMLFDSKERLVSWAQREVGFAALPGHAIVEMMGTDFHWALNVGTAHVKTFVPDEIKWIKGNLNTPEEKMVASGTQVLIGAPSKIPNGLIESLVKSLSSRNGEIKAAYLGQVHYVREGEKPHLALVLHTDINDKSIIEAISKDLAFSTKGFLGDDEYIDIMVNDGNGTALEITKAVKPFYKKSGWLKRMLTNKDRPREAASLSQV
ncbi:enhanced serine sensitivity protein SseB C-terminal domain-containing protein, partial [Shewanella hanedai]